ncbi:ribonuclease Z [Allofustis seminis]|uniref:ribonuclease Z n=1 Tax=Allofustis seminis TaxID=166939 RepID=UPI00037893A5|nr:ribonuclease Z [Allofustis seminis]
MELLFLGTGSGVPAKHRNVSSIALKMLNERNTVWLFDCGEATQHQILHTTLKPRKIEKIFITHLHGDHIYGLPGLLSSRSFQAGEDLLTIYGPKGIKKYVLTSLKLSGAYPTYPLKFVEFEKEGIIFEDHQFKVSIKKLVHGIPSYGFRIEEADHEGTLDADRLQALGVPFGPLYGKLKKGESVQLEDGRIINGKDYIGKDKKGRILAILGDTRPTPATVELAKDADVMVHESTFSAEESDLARNYKHSTNVQAAQLAKDACAKKLLLTHISSRYLSADIAKMAQEARNVFQNTILVKDFTEVVIPAPED